MAKIKDLILLWSRSKAGNEEKDDEDHGGSRQTGEGWGGVRLRIMLCGINVTFMAHFLPKRI